MLSQSETISFRIDLTLHFRYKLLSEAKGICMQLIFYNSRQAVISLKVPCNLKVGMFRLKLELTIRSNYSNLYCFAMQQRTLCSKVHSSCLSFKPLWLKLMYSSTPIISFRSNVLLGIDHAAFSHSIILHMFTGFILHSPCLILLSLRSSLPLPYSPASNDQLSSVNSCYNEYSILSVLSSVNM